MGRCRSFMLTSMFSGIWQPYLTYHTYNDTLHIGRWCFVDLITHIIDGVNDILVIVHYCYNTKIRYLDASWLNGKKLLNTNRCIAFWNDDCYKSNILDELPLMFNKLMYVIQASQFNYCTYLINIKLYNARCRLFTTRNVHYFWSVKYLICEA